MPEGAASAVAGSAVWRIALRLRLLWLFAALAVLPYLLSYSQQEIAVLLVINVLLVCSYRLLTLTGEWSLGHVVIMGVGAYTSALLAKRFGVPVPVSMLAGAFVAAGSAAILSFPLFRMKGFYFLIGSFAAGEIIRLIWKRFTDPFGGPKGLKRIDAFPDIDIGFLKIDFYEPVNFYFLALIVVAASLFVLYRIERSRIGLTFHAIHWQDRLAESVGVDTFRYRTLALRRRVLLRRRCRRPLRPLCRGGEPHPFRGRPDGLCPGLGDRRRHGDLPRPDPGRCRADRHQRDRVARARPGHGPALDLRRHPDPVDALLAGRAGEPGAEIAGAPAAPGRRPRCGRRGTGGMSGPGDAPILEARSLIRRFGGLVAVDNFSFAVREGAIHGLIGPNGAGKTTTFNVISGFYAPNAGQVLYRGRDIAGRKTSALAAMGLVRTFQGSTLFQEFSVLDNVRVGRHITAGAGFVSRLLGTDRASERAADAKAWDTLAFFGLEDLAGEAASSLSHGHQRMLGMAVALAAEPKVLLLDEPFTGMNPEETRRMMSLVRRIRDDGVTVMLVEHDMQAVMNLCDIVTVMNFGALLVEGAPDAVRNDPAVIEAYLGTAANQPAGGPAGG